MKMDVHTAVIVDSYIVYACFMGINLSQKGRFRPETDRGVRHGTVAAAPVFTGCSWCSWLLLVGLSLCIYILRSGA